jgi:hypothetical protein
VNFMDISSIFLPFGKFYGHSLYFVIILVYFFPFWYVVPKESGNPGVNPSPT